VFIIPSRIRTLLIDQDFSSHSPYLQGLKLIMDNFSKIPSLKIILISLSVNLIICCTLLPLAIQPYQIFTFRQLLEIMLWQGLANIGWIIPLLFSSLAFFRLDSLQK